MELGEGSIFHRKVVTGRHGQDSALRLSPHFEAKSMLSNQEGKNGPYGKHKEL